MLGPHYRSLQQVLTCHVMCCVGSIVWTTTLFVFNVCRVIVLFVFIVCSGRHNLMELSSRRYEKFTCTPILLKSLVVAHVL